MRLPMVEVLVYLTPGKWKFSAILFFRFILFRFCVSLLFIIDLTWHVFSYFCTYFVLFICRTECEAQVEGFAGAIFKKFKTTDEATDFIKQKQPKNATVSVRSDLFASGATVRIFFFFFRQDFFFLTI